jgi:curved DNA-binding protein CbpA
MSKNYYDILGVSPGVSLDELEKAYRSKARECHPDRAAINNLTVEEATKKFQELGEAFNKLKEEIEAKPSNNGAFPKSDPSDPRFWTEPISPEERERTSEEAIQRIESHFAYFGVKAEDLEISDFALLFFYSDWKDMMRWCFNRREFNTKYNQMLDAIERAAARKENESFQANVKKGFATKEEADEYAKKKQAEDEELDKRKNSQFSDKEKNNPFTSPAPGKDYSSSSKNSQENESTDNLNPDFKQSVKAEVSDNNDKNTQQTKINSNLKNDYLNQNLLKEFQPNLLKEYQKEQKETLESLKKQLAELQKQQSGLQNKISQQDKLNSPTNNNFSWLWVVIPMGVITLFFGLIICYLLGKQKRKN